MNDFINNALSNYQTKQEFRLMSQFQMVRQEIQSKQYKDLIKEIENTNIVLLEILEQITKQEIQDVSYILKPSQQLYDSVCGLNSFVAGMNRAIPQEYLFVKIKDWVNSQGLFCINFGMIVDEIRQIQHNLFKKRINVLNIQEAKKFQTANVNYFKDNFKQLSINEKLCQLLSQCLKYANLFYKIEKYHQNFDKQEKKPQIKKTDEVNYLEGKVNNNFFNKESEENSSEEVYEMDNLERQYTTPEKNELKNFKTFSSYQQSVNKSHSNSCRQSLNLSTVDKRSANSPTFGQRFSIRKETQQKKNETTNRKLKLPKREKTPPPPKTPPKMPIVLSPDLKKLEHEIVKAFEGETIDNNQDLDTLERNLKVELQRAEKQIVDLKKFSKRLEWEEDKKSKQKNQKKQQEKEMDSYRSYQTYSDNRNSFKEEQEQRRKEWNLNSASLKLSLFSSRQQYSKVIDKESDLKFKQIQNLHQELQKKVKEKEGLARDVAKQQKLVFQ